jgi:lipopolysaccharide export system protein LptA
MRLLVIRYVLASFAALALVTTAQARIHKDTWSLDKTVTIGSTQVKPGSYQLNGDDAKKELTVLQNGKVIATASGQWVKLPQKADYTSVETTGDKVTQVLFGGSDQAFQPQ